MPLRTARGMGGSERQRGCDVKLMGFCSIMKKNFILWLTASAVVILALPWLAVTLVKGDAGMAVCFLLFFAINGLSCIRDSGHADFYVHQKEVEVVMEYTAPQTHIPNKP